MTEMTVDAVDLSSADNVNLKKQERVELSKRESLLIKELINEKVAKGDYRVRKDNGIQKMYLSIWKKDFQDKFIGRPEAKNVWNRLKKYTSPHLHYITFDTKRIEQMYVVSMGNQVHGPRISKAWPSKAEGYLSVACLVCGIFPELIHIMIHPCYRLHVVLAPK